MENYFIMPEVILDFIAIFYDREGKLFKPTYHKCMREIIDRRLLSDVFAGDNAQLQEFHNASKSLRRTLLKNIKMSRFTQQVFEEFSHKEGQTILLKKGEFHQLLEYVKKEDIPKEVSEKLDLLVEYLKWEKGSD